ncbi:MAG: hypothetical protein CME29_01090 [Gemmatimonadetes bacterium]|nr:hypothetical protein [Gemmatimonadota bacterium]|tara:strand:+ start:2495 stop:2914 length:420 start_codon:yes stop_codon:yes gene_type:complete
MDNEKESLEIDGKSSSGAGAFVLGALLGAGLALVLTPRTGHEIQKRIKEKAEQLRESAKDNLVGQGQTLETRIDDLRDGIESQIRLVKDIVESSQKVKEMNDRGVGHLFEGHKQVEGEGYAPPESLRISAEMTFEEEED